MIWIFFIYKIKNEKAKRNGVLSIVDIVYALK